MKSPRLLLIQAFAAVVAAFRAVACLALSLAAAECIGNAAAAEKPAVVVHPTQAELEQGFAGWAARYPDAFTFETRGRTPEGRPMLMARITDRRVPDVDKQVALLTSAHGAKEMNALTGLLRFIQWLISDDAEAAEIRRRQIVLVVPYTGPDFIARGDHSESRPIYGGWAAPGMRLWSVKGVARAERENAVALEGHVLRGQSLLRAAETERGKDTILKFTW